jgi:hypothetical protein
MFTTKAQQAKAQQAKEEAKKLGLLSQLEMVKIDLSRVQSGINQNIRDANKSIVAGIATQLNEMIDASLTERGPPVPNTVTFDISSLSKELTGLKKEQHNAFEQQAMIEELIQKIQSSKPIPYSELEKQIIAILSVKSFLESQAVARLQRMINLCPSILQCLQLLETYSEKFFKGMKYGPNEDEHEDEHEHEHEDEDESIPKIDSKKMRLFYEKLDTLLHQLTELQQKIDGIKTVFSERYSLKSLFSGGCHLLLSLLESSQQLQDELEQKTLDFQTFRNKVVTFFEEECAIRKRIFLSETADDTFYSTFHSQFDKIHEQLGKALKRIKC